MSKRLIDANELISAMYYYEHNEGRLTAYDAQDIINKAPTIEPKRGKWIDMGDFEQCSVCKGTRLKEFQSYYGKTTWIKTPYCPNCGADMRGKDDE